MSCTSASTYKPLHTPKRGCYRRKILPLSSPPTEIVPAASMVDIYIYTEVNMLLQFNDRHMHSLRKVATFIGKKGEPGNKARGVKAV